jgi:hypothetical protein
MDPFYTRLILWVRILTEFLNVDIVEKMGEEIKLFTHQRLRLKKCGEALNVLWESEMRDSYTLSRKIKDIILEQARFDGSSNIHYTSTIHPGRHFLPSGRMRNKHQLCNYPIDNIIRYNCRGGPDSSKMYVGGHELFLVSHIEGGWRLFRGCGKGGERGRITFSSDPIFKILEDLKFTKKEMWELEFGSKKKIINHKKRIYNHLLSLE